MKLSILAISAPLLLGTSSLGLFAVAQAPQTQQQPKTYVYTGVVVDSKGMPLPGAAVLIQDEKSGAMTDVDGKFLLRSSHENITIMVRMMGYVTRTLKARERDNLTILLQEEVGTIQEVVVTGFAPRRKDSYTGSQSTVKRQELLAMGTKNVMQSLEAFVPGLVVAENNLAGSNPNARPDFSIRGRASFEGSSNMPVFVVDGAEVSADYVYDMDINDIEQVDVLKDASASALYGAKASAGVIVITTKVIEGGKLKLNYSGTARVSMPDLSEYNLLDARQKLEYERLAGLFIGSDTEDQYMLDRQYANLQKQVLAGQNTDWLSKPLRNGLTHTHSLSVDGGDTRAKYNVGIRYSDDQGVMKGSSRERLSSFFKLNYNVVNRLTLTNTMDVTFVNAEESPYGSFSQYVRMNPYENPYEADGTLRQKLYHNIDNPLWDAERGSFDRSESFDFRNTTNLQLFVTKELRLNADFSFGRNKAESKVFVSPFAASQTNLDVASRGSLTENFSKSIVYQGKAMLSYNKYVLPRLYLSVMGGMSVESNESQGSRYQSIGFYTDKLSSPAFASTYAEGRPGGSDSYNTGLGFFANLNAIYANKYFLDFIYRYEGSSKFGKDNRYAPFWSLGGGWNVHNEDWLKDKGVELLKLRASVGYLGNISFPAYQALTTYSYVNGYNYVKGYGARPITIGNPDLTWERTLSVNFGVDAKLFKGLIDLSADYYIKSTDNLLLDVTKAPSVGIAAARENLGEVENKGFELRISSTPIRTNDLQWTISGTFSTNSNKIKRISNSLRLQNERAIADTTGTSPLPIYVEGQSLNTLMVVPSAGIDPATGQEIYIKRNGSYTFDYDGNDRVNFGTTTPIGQGTLNSYLTYKRFSLTASFGYAFGGVAYNSTLATRVEGSNPNYNADVRVFNDRWREPGDRAVYKNIADTSTPMQTSRFVHTNNYFTLRTLSIGYDVPTVFTNKLGMRRIRVEALTNDLFYITSIKQERGLDYPFDRSFEVSLRFSL